MKKIIQAFFCGVLFFALLAIPSFPVKAQFGGPVTVVADTSASGLLRTANSTKTLVQQTQQTLQQLKMVAQNERSFASQIAEYAKIAGRWLETVKHYTNEIFNLTRQFTSLRGMLGLAEQELGLKADDLKAAREIVDAVRGVLAVKEQFETLLQTRLVLVRNWEQRAKNGIFNPQADWQDLKDYLKNGLGRQQANDDLLLRLPEIDPEYARWNEELKRLRKREAELTIEKRSILQRMERERGLQQRPRTVVTDDLGNSQIDQTNRVSTSVQTVIALQNNLQAVEKQLFDVQTRIQELLNLMERRYAEAFWQMYEQWEKATAVGDATEGWQQFGAVKIEKLGEMVDFNGEPVREIEDQRLENEIVGGSSQP